MAVATTQSWQEHTSNGSTAYFPFNFNYDTTRPGTIVVGKRTADNTYSVVNASNYELIPNAAGDGGQIRFIQNPSGSQIIDDIPPAGTIIRIERVSVDTSSATWQIGLEMSELVNLFDRLFRLVQENKGGFDNVIKTFETQHNVSLYEMLASHNNRLFYWDDTNKTITPTDFPKEDVVRATNGLFLRVGTDSLNRPQIEWSLNGTTDWHSINSGVELAEQKVNKAGGDTMSGSYILTGSFNLNNANSTDSLNWNADSSNNNRYKWSLNSNTNIGFQYDSSQRSLMPITNGGENLGRAANRWNRIYANYLDSSTGGNKPITIPQEMGTMALLSDIGLKSSDVVLNNLQDGQFLEYDATLQKWKNVTSSYSIGFSAITGNPMDNANLATALNAKANIDLNNLTATGANIANWSHNVTNCPTKMPQDINIESPSNNLVLKSGSKVYVPNGSGVYTPIQMSADVSRSDFSVFGSGTYLVFYSQSYGGLIAENITTCVSGATDPSTASSHVWYDTTENKIKIYENGSYTRTDLSLPICVMTNTYGTGVVSIDEVFNGVGYIGVTIFRTGIDYLIPNKFNSDGTLKNTTVSTTSCATYTVSSPTVNHRYNIAGASNGNIALFYTNIEYNEKENLNYAGGSQTAWADLGSVIFTGSPARITSFNPKQVFHAVDYSEFKYGNVIIEGKYTFNNPITAERVVSPNEQAFLRLDDGSIGRASLYVKNASNQTESIRMEVDSTGFKTHAPTPSSAQDNTTKIATTAWVHQNQGFVVSYQAPTSSNNYTWAIKYSNGWVRQGGTVSASGTTTVNLPYGMSDTNYSATGGARYTTNDEWDPCGIERYSSTQIKVNKQNAAYCCWVVEGMGA